MINLNTESYDAVIIGGGPAGAQCGLWLKMLGYNPIILEKSNELGGLQRQSPYENNWIVCLPGYTGIQIAASIQDNLIQHNVSFLTHVTNLRIDKNKGFDVIFCVDNKEYSITGKKLVIATGVKNKTGNFMPDKKILIGSGNIIDDYDFSNKRVAILGGGDNAAENYQFIKNKGSECVKIFARTLRARKELVSKINQEDLSIGEFIADSDSMKVNKQEFDLFCIMFGWEPVNPLLGSIDIKLDSNGFIKVDNDCRTSDRDIFAIGECSQRVHPCVTTAMADGVIAAKVIQYDFEDK